jgi:UDPglucose--hexose-1-phosphate uridylyltransferase
MIHLSELRWNPVLREWVVTATHRQDRTFMPPKDYCPLCPTKPDGIATEVPAQDYQIVVFENKFPSFKSQPPEPSVEGTPLFQVRPSQGICEVLLYSSNHEGSLAQESPENILNLIHVWADRYVELGSEKFVDYVLIFENKGEAIGVTLTHPHGQIYAFPYIPPKPAQELSSAQEYMERTGRCLFCDITNEELQDGRRIVIESRDFLAVVPFYARYPYEVHITSKEHRGSIDELSNEERHDLAKVLNILLRKYDNLFGFPFPYIMVMHQKPTDGKEYPHYHFHIEFYPPHRSADKLKYLAGCESGAGTFINDTLPEEKAAELREVAPIFTK